MRKKEKTVGEYIAGAPLAVRGKLRQLRSAIRKAAPQAIEKISYGMPYYSYKGRLAYFRLSKAHIGLYIPSPVIQEHKRELKGYDAEGATVRFPLGRNIPKALVRKLVLARIKKNESRE